jgi:branched-chain amino acid transport system permease protein
MTDLAHPSPADEARQGIRPATVAFGAVLLAALIALPYIAGALGMNSLINLGSRVLIYAIAVASLNIALGFGGLVSFGHAAFFGIGAYVVAMLSNHADWGTPFLGVIPGTNSLILCLLAAMICAGLAAAIIGALSLRTGGIQFIMSTLAFAQMIYFMFTSLSAYGGDDGLMMPGANEFFGLNLRNRTSFYFLCLTIAVAGFWLYWQFMRSSFAAVLDGVRQSPQRMQALGLSPTRHRLTAFVLSGIGAGLAGGLLANLLRFSSPDTLSWNTSGLLMIMLILGGVGTLWGPFLGAMLILVLEDVFGAWTENWPLVLGIVLLLVVLNTHGGVVALIRRVTGGRL